MSVCTKTQDFYKGDGSTTTFPFSFEYPADRPDFIKVALWDTTQRNYLDTTEWSFDGPTIVKFDVAPPPAPTDEATGDLIDNIRIYRITDVDILEATFYPGSAIKADDLNDTFIQLQNSIQEIQCYDNSEGYTGNVDELDFYLKRADDSILGYIDNISNEAFRLPIGTTAQRPNSPNLGDARYNTSINKIEFFEDGGWIARDSDVSALFEALPTDGSPITSGQALVPILFPDGLLLPDQTSSYAQEGAIRVNLSNEKLEVFIDGDWTTASAGAEVNDTPPTTATQGDVWWDSESGRAYVRYRDDDSSQWVEMNPSWNGSVADGVITPDKLSPGGPSWDTNGNLTVDGTGTFADRVSAVGLTSTGASILADRASADDVNFLNRLNGTSTARWQADGTIILGTSQDITLNATDGSATFATRVTAGSSFEVLNTNPGSGPGYYVFNAKHNGSDVVKINNDGSAWFKGNVTSDGTIGFNLEADDDTKYTTTTDSEGIETRVYNGAVLDVRQLLLSLQTAASRIETLETEVKALKGALK